MRLSSKQEIPGSNPGSASERRHALAALAASHPRPCCLGHHTNTRCNAGLLLIVFEKHQCSTCRPMIQLPHHGNAAMAEWLRRLTRNQMGSSRVGSNPTRSGNSYLRWPERKTQLPQGPTPPHPQPKLGTVGHCCQGSVSPAQRHAALPFLEVCCSSCCKAMASTRSNRYHLCHQQVQLVVGPHQHQPNRQPCHTRTCATTALVRTAYLGPTRRSVPSRPFGTAT